MAKKNQLFSHLSRYCCRFHDLASAYGQRCCNLLVGHSAHGLLEFSPFDRHDFLAETSSPPFKKMSATP